MFSETDPKGALHVDPGHGAHDLYTTLVGPDREAFLQLLDEHLRTTEQVCGFAREVRWRLRKLNYQAIKELFKGLDQATQHYAAFLQGRIQALGGTLPHDNPQARPLAEAEQAPGFRECFKEIHQLSQHLADLVSRAQRFMDRAVDASDYGTANLVSEVLYRANQLIYKIKLEIPSGESFISECRQPTRPQTWFSTMEIWAHGPGSFGAGALDSHRL